MRKKSIPPSNQQIYENTRNTDKCVIYKTQSPPSGPETSLGTGGALRDGRGVAGREGDYRPFRTRRSATRSGAATTRNPKQQTAEF